MVAQPLLYDADKIEGVVFLERDEHLMQDMDEAPFRRSSRLGAAYVCNEGGICSQRALSGLGRSSFGRFVSVASENVCRAYRALKSYSKALREVGRTPQGDLV